MKTSLLFISVFCLSFTHTGGIDYREVFGNDYVWAVNWLKKNDQLIAKYARVYNVPAKELKAIIFPELIRYNAVFDALEVESLKFLYVSEGSEYANFSVGFFQMKPSFAEMVETDADKRFGYPRTVDNEDDRKARVYRLTDAEQQIVYLCAFYDICEKKFSGRNFANLSDKLRFYATAYNSGYHIPVKTLEAMQSRKHFKGYNYAEISLFYFSHQDYP